ncbi:MAG: hypothetical protein GXO10_05905 [Crenarchaeota archaeon]|nr:hypothetical protein [Thermoproteota archaeon]
MYAPYREPRIHIALIALAVVLAAVSVVLALLNLSFFKTSYMSYGVFIQTIEDILITCLLAVVVAVQVLIIRQLYQRRSQPAPPYPQPVSQPAYTPYPQPAQYRPPQPPQLGPLAPPPRAPQPPQPQPPTPGYTQGPAPQQPAPQPTQIPAIFEESIESGRTQYPQPPRTEPVLRPPTPSQPTQIIPRSTVQRQPPLTRPQPQQKSEREEEKSEER